MHTKMSEELRDYVAQQGVPQNRNEIYASSRWHYQSFKKVRYLSDKLFIVNIEIENLSCPTDIWHIDKLTYVLGSVTK